MGAGTEPGMRCNAYVDFGTNFAFIYGSSHPNSGLQNLLHAQLSLRFRVKLQVKTLGKLGVLSPSCLPAQKTTWDLQVFRKQC